MTADGERTVSVGRDAFGNVIVTGDSNQVTLTVVVVDERLAAQFRSSGLATGTLPNPYPGLAAFHETDEAWFFGRRRLVRSAWVAFQNLQRSSGARILAVVGASGSGKSSLVRAGMIPELARNPLKDMGNPKIAVLRPGRAPLQALAQVLGRLWPELALSESGLRTQSPEDVYAILAARLPRATDGTSYTLIVVVDQFEELYTECEDSGARRQFLALLAHAAMDSNRNVSVILTLRSDFVGAVREPEPFASALSTKRILVDSMRRDELEEAIAEPARRMGHPFDPALVDALIAQVEGRAGALPLLQFALRRVWEDHCAGRLDPRIGARLIEEFLVEAADTLYETTGEKPEERERNQRIIQRAFVAMVQLGEGTADTRRVATLSEIVTGGHDRELVRSVLAPFATPEARLISTSRTAEEETYELVHEALIAAWQPLRAWLGDVPDKSERTRIRSDILFHRRLSEAAEDWAHGRGELWRGADLRRLNQLAKHLRDNITPAEHRFWRRSALANVLWKGIGATATIVVITVGIIYALTRLQATMYQNARLENIPLEVGKANVERRMLNTEPSRPVILLAFSGGGSRAAALSWVILRELKNVLYTIDGQTRRLIDDVAVISSVSGGSVTAAWFGLTGAERIDELGPAFLERDNIGSMQLVGVDLITWLQHGISGRTLKGLLDDRLYHGSSFRELNQMGKPFIILNASDLVSGEVFPFTPSRFDDICSDLDALSVSTAVAASAATPILLPPVGFNNYSATHCPGRPVPAWITSKLEGRYAPFTNINQYKRASYANDLRHGVNRSREIDYLYLSDGGLADSLGLHGLLDAISSPGGPGEILLHMNDGDIKKLVVIVVNGNSAGPLPSSASPTGPSDPGIFAMVNSIGMAATASSGQTQLDVLMAEIGRVARTDVQFGGLRVYGLRIAFDQLGGMDERQRALLDKAKGMPALWTISPNDLMVIEQTGKLLLHQQPCFQRLLLDLQINAKFLDPDFAKTGCPG